MLSLHRQDIKHSRPHSTLTLSSPPCPAGDTIHLQLRFPYRKQVLEERRIYVLVDLLTDLGGTMGLLLGYSLSSLVDVGDWIVTSLAVAQRKR